VQRPHLLIFRTVAWGAGVLLLTVIGIGVAGALRMAAQASAPAPATATKSSAAELSTQDVMPSFRIQVQRNVVLVRVVVRDAKGHTVPGLTKDDFILLEGKKPEAVSSFNVEHGVPLGGGEIAPTTINSTPSAGLTPPKPVLVANRFTALYFDDVNSSFDEISRSRTAALRYLAAAMKPGDRIGIGTSSGMHMLDFTFDRGAVEKALNAVIPQPIFKQSAQACPQIFDYESFMITIQNDPFSKHIADEEAYQCICVEQGNPSPGCPAMAAATARGRSAEILNRTEMNANYALEGLDKLIRRMGSLPGQRSIALVSPGFIALSVPFQVDEVVDRALRANVVINALDDRGLYTDIPMGDASKNPILVPGHPEVEGLKAQLIITRNRVADDVLQQISSETGGAFFHNSNDFDAGFRVVGSFPSVYYVLGYSPKGLKYDGKFHPLTVKLANNLKYSVQARRGFFAPKQAPDSVEQAKEEIENAVFSQDQVSEIPMAVHTQFFKTTPADARLSVLTHLDLRRLHFRKAEGRNLNDLTVVTALFDTNGKFVQATEKVIHFRLRDTTLARVDQTGITMRTSFQVKSGDYLVREVVRDGETAQISASNDTIQIP
jgi:VWFA-related protein